MGAALLVAAAAVAQPAPETSISPQVALIVVCPDEALVDLTARLLDAVGPARGAGAVQLVRAAAFDPDEPLRADGPDAGRPTAWVVVDGLAALVRATNAGRDRYVFRDLAVSSPLTELDRERIGQMVKTALVTVVEGGGGRRTRDDLPPAAAVRSAPAPAAARPPPIRVGAGVYFLMAAVQSQYPVYGAGIALSFESTRSHQPGIWLSLMRFLPYGLGDPGMGYGTSFRAGLSVRPPTLPSMRLDLGAGADWDRTGYHAGGDDRVFVGRVASCLGPADLGVVKASATVFVDVSPRIFFNRGAADELDVRPGFALELGWR
jgi:hypothetical protein